MEKLYKGDEKTIMLWLFIVAILVLISILGVLIYGIIVNKKVKKSMLITVQIILIATLAILAFLIEPKESNDLFRHFEKIDLIREKGFGIKLEYDYLIIVRLLFNLVALLPSNHFLPAISVIITYGISMYIIYDFTKRNETTSRVTSIAILLSFALCSFYVAASGIRNAMACSFLALGLYLDLIRKEKLVKKIWPYIIAALIHPVAYIVIIIRLLLNIKWLSKIKYVILLIGLLYRPIMNLLKLINLEITNYLAQKMNAYLVVESKEDIRWMLVIWMFLIFLYVISIIIEKKNKDEKFEQYLNFVQIYILSIFALTFVVDIFTRRLTFLLAFLMIPFVYLIEENLEKNQKIFCYGVLIFLLCGLLPYGLAELRNTGFMLD